MSKRTAATRSVNAADIAVIAAFAALIIVLGAVTVPVGSAGVPIVLQNMGVLLAAMILGRRRGGLAVLLFLGVGLLGVPNMAGWTPLLADIPGPTIGYIVGYAVTGFVVGALCDLAPRNPRWARLVWYIVAGAVGVLIQYGLGTVGLVLRADMDFGAALVSNGPFLPGDAAKVVFAALVSTAVLRAVPDLDRRRGTRTGTSPDPAGDTDRTVTPAAPVA